MSRIFLSHSSIDELETVAFKEWLAANGWHDVFLELEPQRGLAAQRGIPNIPVVLLPCPWEEQPLLGDPRKRKLGAIGALPKALMPFQETNRMAPDGIPGLRTLSILRGDRNPANPREQLQFRHGFPVAEMKRSYTT